MRKILILTTILLMSSITIAQQIHAEDAIRVSKNLIKTARNDSLASETEFVAVRRNVIGDTVMYEVMMDNGLSVFVSGNRRTKPILGVCENYGTSILYNLDDIPDGLKCMLDNYYDQIEYAFGSDSMMMGVNSEWSEAIKGNLPSVDTIVNSILTTKWGQTQSNDGNHLIAYNYYMPQGACTTGSNCPAGCVAVAMAQVMNHWKTPTFFSNNLEFDWCNVVDALFASSNDYETERNAISYLLHYCGLSVGMNYCFNNSCGGSAAYTEDIDDVLPTIFGYSSDAVYRTRANYSDYEWLSYIKSNLNNGWPVIYRGSSSMGGHSFVCDGYLSDNRFSFNWGWNGLYNNN